VEIIVAYWAFDFFGPILLGAADFLGGITASQYAQGIPLGVLVNTLGAGLPVLVMMHVVFIPRIAVLFDNKLTVILFGGLYYALFSFFDQGADYNTLQTALTSFTYIIMTQTLVGMGKAAFTIVTGNPFVHFITLHVLSARIPFDTRMYIDIFTDSCREKEPPRLLQELVLVSASIYGMEFSPDGIGGTLRLATVRVLPAPATIDRLLHHAHVFSLKGDSYRM
jgi:hypothetical protein